MYDYKKFNRDGECGGKLTGTIINQATMKDYIVVDVDNEVQPEDKDTIPNFENNIKKLFVPENTDNVYIEMTGNYGLHIILKNDLDLSGLEKNRFTKIYKGEGYEIDIFAPVNEKRSMLVVAMPHEDNSS